MPALSMERWEAAGEVPATGQHTRASDGDAPIWAGSHSTEVWRADADRVWEASVVSVTPTIAERVLRPGAPDHAFRSSGGRLERTTDGGATGESLSLGSLDVQPIDEVWAIGVRPWAPVPVPAGLSANSPSFNLRLGLTRLLGRDPVAVSLLGRVRRLSPAIEVAQSFVILPVDGSIRWAPVGALLEGADQV